MPITRRTFLAALASAGTAAVLERALANPGGLPSALLPVSAAERGDFASHVMHRLTFGPRPGLLEEIRSTGPETWIERQLAYDTLADSAELLAALQRLETIWRAPSEIFAQGEPPENRGQYFQELQIATLLRATYSTRQLYELMVQFWNNHFSIFMADGPIVFLKATDDREVIRPHALGRFLELLNASAHSPAMLLYLDNASNNRRAPNENYARELLELHTLGVDGGYTEDDVKALARLLTGWSVGGLRDPIATRGAFVFHERAHDPSAQTVLGQTFDGALGEEAGVQALQMLASHPSTAHFIATKLVRRFVADSPPQGLVTAAAETFLASDGDIPAVLRVIFASDEFRNAPPKLKLPWNYMVSLLRAFDARIEGSGRPQFRALSQYMRALGHTPFLRETPDGYPDVAEAWRDNLLGRWNLAFAIVLNAVPGVHVDLVGLVQRAHVETTPRAVLDYFTDLLLGYPLSEAERAELWDYVSANGEPNLRTQEGQLRLAEGIALLAASPAFQYR